MVQTVVASVAQPDRVADGLRDRAADDQPDEHQRRHEHQADGDEQHHRAQLPDRPALVDLVDPVHGAAEGAHVARCRPDRAGEAEDQGEPGALGAYHLVDRALQLRRRPRPGRAAARCRAAWWWSTRPGRTGRAARPGRGSRGRRRAPSSRSARPRGRCTGRAGTPRTPPWPCTSTRACRCPWGSRLAGVVRVGCRLARAAAVPSRAMRSLLPPVVPCDTPRRCRHRRPIPPAADGRRGRRLRLSDTARHAFGGSGPRSGRLWR